MTLADRPIVLAGERRPNFMTLQQMNADGTTSLYAVFFAGRKEQGETAASQLEDSIRLSSRTNTNQTPAPGEEGGLKTLLRATYEGRKIRP